MLERLALFERTMECPFCESQIAAHSRQCNRCGKTIPPAQYLLEESGILEPTEETPSGASAPAPVRQAARHRFARLGDRFIAFVLDTVFLFGLFAMVDAWAFMRWGMVEGSELQLTSAALVIAITLNAAVLFLYGWLLEAAFGATLGKAMVGIRVVGTARSGPLSACAVRNVLRIIDGLGFYLVGTVVAGCSGIRQRIGDVYAHTAVIEENFGMGIRTAAVMLWIASLAGAGWAVPRICSANAAVHPAFLSQVLVRVGRSGNAAYVKIAGFTADVQMASNAR